MSPTRQAGPKYRGHPALAVARARVRTRPGNRGSFHSGGTQSVFLAPFLIYGTGIRNRAKWLKIKDENPSNLRCAPVPRKAGSKRKRPARIWRERGVRRFGRQQVLGGGHLPVGGVALVEDFVEGHELAGIGLADRLKGKGIAGDQFDPVDVCCT